MNPENRARLYRPPGFRRVEPRAPRQHRVGPAFMEAIHDFQDFVNAHPEIRAVRPLNQTPANQGLVRRVAQAITSGAAHAFSADTVRRVLRSAWAHPILSLIGSSLGTSALYLAYASAIQRDPLNALPQMTHLGGNLAIMSGSTLGGTIGALISPGPFTWEAASRGGEYIGRLFYENVELPLRRRLRNFNVHNQTSAYSNLVNGQLALSGPGVQTPALGHFDSPFEEEFLQLQQGQPQPPVPIHSMEDEEPSPLAFAPGQMTFSQARALYGHDEAQALLRLGRVTYDL